MIKQFDIVKGDDIKYWYKGNNYEGNGGTFKWILYENSDSELFDLYSMNSNVSLVILYDDNGSIDDNENTHLIKLRTCDTLENR
jgi:hypothetical protein